MSSDFWEKIVENQIHFDINYIVVPCFSSFKAQRDNFSFIMNICTMFDLFDELVSAIDLLYSNVFFIVFWVIKSFSQSLTYSHDVLIYVGLQKAHASAASLSRMNLVSIKIRESGFTVWVRTNHLMNFSLYLYLSNYLSSYSNKNSSMMERGYVCSESFLLINTYFLICRSMKINNFCHFSLGAARSTMSYDDRRVCRPFLLSCCPHEVLTGTVTLIEYWNEEFHCIAIFLASWYGRL